jgi:hypothetical protein
LREIANELRKAGKTAAASYVDQKASSLLAKLRAEHVAAGGTPLVVKDHYGNGVSGYLPANIAKHYGGTLEQLQKANPGKKAWEDWKVGSTWLLPLSWRAEEKAPPPVASLSKKQAKPATDAQTSPAKTIRGKAVKGVKS